jgi:lipopolysaccharide export LptBFGC system permease protein LptF
MEALGILMVPVLILLLVLALLAFLLPYYVFAIAGRTLKLLAQAEEQTKLLKQLQQRGDSSAAIVQSLQTNNQLLRQLLRAYGHEPEV